MGRWQNVTATVYKYFAFIVHCDDTQTTSRVKKVKFSLNKNDILDKPRGVRRSDEYFKELLDYAAPRTPRFTTNKAPGEDGMSKEIYNTCPASAGPWLHRVISKVRTD